MFHYIDCEIMCITLINLSVSESSFGKLAQQWNIILMKLIDFIWSMWKDTNFNNRKLVLLNN